MVIDLAALPDDADALRAIVLAQAAALADQRGLIERLRLQLARLRRMQFGRSSERLAAEADQLELALEELETEAPTPPPAEDPADVPARPERRKPARRPLPEHLPREVVEHCAGTQACVACGGKLRHLGEDVTEVLDYLPGRFRVLRHVRPKFSCRGCEAISQAPAPSLPIRRGRATAGLLAHVLVAKYADHLPLYRQSEIYARAGLDLQRSTLADWVGQSAALLRPLLDALARHVLAGAVLHADDTPVPVLAPGLGRTSTGRLWAYLRDERPHAARSRPPCSTATAPTAGPSIPRRISAGSAACCRPTAMPGSTGCTTAARCRRQRAGRMPGATSSSCTPPARRRWRPRRCAASPCSTPSSRTSAASRPPRGQRSARPGRGRSSRACAPGLTKPSPGSPAAAIWPWPSAMRCRGGRR